MNSLNVKQGDNVVVIAGKDKGKKGRVLNANPDARTVKVDNVNVVTKHRKPRGAQNPGGISKEPGNIDVSNVQIICPSCNKATRVKAGEADGKKVRACGKCGASLDVKVKAEKKKKTAAKKEDAAPVKKTAKKSAKKDEAVAEQPVAEQIVTDETAAAPEAEEKPAKKPAAKKTTAKKAEKTDAEKSESK